MALTAAVATMLAPGLTAITNAITSGLPIEISKFELGGLAAVAVPSDTTTAMPEAIYTGDPSRVLLEQENGLATFNIILDEAIGDFFVGNLALKIIDPVLGTEVPLCVVMFPSTVIKMASEENGGATGETGNYYLVKLVLKLSTMQSLATVTLSPTSFATLPSVDSINSLADPSATNYPHQLLLKAPETGAPALLARRAGDNLWWGFSLSWPAGAHDFGVISGGYQGDAYQDDGVEVLFGGYFHLTDSDVVEEINGGTNWSGGTNINLISGGFWS